MILEYCQPQKRQKDLPLPSHSQGSFRCGKIIDQTARRQVSLHLDLSKSLQLVGEEKSHQAENTFVDGPPPACHQSCKAQRSFASRRYATAARVKELDFYTRLGKEFLSDLAWWHTFSRSRSLHRSCRSDSGSPDLDCHRHASEKYSTLL